ncbi:MAG TPA: helix-turn-helix transcriptional regulator [Gallionellaceae bacterium]|nr:helix-turn-helix transcriptional regulator [Gallionellaceae bacterium]
MANVASLLKEEITRLARKEIRSEIEGLRKASAHYRSDIAALKKRIAVLEQQVSRLGKAASRTTDVESNQEVSGKIRFSAKGFKTLRERLGLTASATGALLGVSGQTIYSWETGRSRPRKHHLERLAYLRKMSKRDVDAVIRQLAG